MTFPIDLADPATFTDGPPFAALAELRAEAPVHWHPGGGGFWVVLGHGAVVETSRTPEVFSAETGGVVLEDLPPAQLEMMRHMLLAMDPPRHQAHRAPLADRFRARVIAGMADRVRSIVRDALDAGGDGRVEFVHDVCAAIPARVVADLMGIPDEDIDHLHELAEKMAAGQASDLVDGDSAAGGASIEMAMYAIEFAARRRTEPPKDDLTTLVLEGDFGEGPMSDVDFGSFFVQLVTAGNDTTRTMLSSGLWALLTHPDQLAALRADRSLIPGAIEEILRWANPLHYFRRTATRDAVLAGQPVLAGDKVVMYYTAANRDPEVFDDPDRFDITRSPNPHLSFGIGEHFCLGVHVARLEGRVFFDELLDRYDDISLAGAPVRTASNLNNGLSALPVVLG